MGIPFIDFYRFGSNGPSCVDFSHAVSECELPGIQRARKVAQNAARALQAVELPDDQHGGVCAVVVRSHWNQDNVFVTDLTVAHVGLLSVHDSTSRTFWAGPVRKFVFRHYR